jgi:hypothetical protein
VERSKGSDFFLFSFCHVKLLNVEVYFWVHFSEIIFATSFVLQRTIISHHNGFLLVEVWRVERWCVPTCDVAVSYFSAECACLRSS